MKRRISRVEFQASIQLGNLPGYRKDGYNVVIAVAFETYLILVPGVRNLDASLVNPGYTAGGPGNKRSAGGRVGIRLVRVVAVLALHVLADQAHREILDRIMNTGKILHRMDERLGDHPLDVRHRDIPVVADKAVVLFENMLEQTSVAGGRVGDVAILASVFRNCLKICIGPWVGPEAVPSRPGNGMGAYGPSRPLVAGDAKV